MCLNTCRSGNGKTLCPYSVSQSRCGGPWVPNLLQQCGLSILFSLAVILTSEKSQA